jgi:hypothetical protein
VSNDHPAGEHTSVSGVPASSPQPSPPTAEISQKTADPSLTASPQAPSPQTASPQTASLQTTSIQAASPQSAVGSDKNQTGAAHATTRDSLTPSVDSDEDDTQSVTSPNPSNRKRFSEPPPMVDGYTRQDVPDLLRQANIYEDRGEYRLARYEYRLVLRLDRDNSQAREGLRRLWQRR